MDHRKAYDRLTGIFPAIPTALTPDENLDEAAQRRLVEFLLGGGVHGLWVLGTGGETAALTDEVRLRTVQVTVEAVAGRVPVVVGVGEAGTRRTIDRIRQIEGLDVTAVAVIAPYFFFHPAPDLVLHYTTIAEASHLPVMIYNNPFNTHNPMDIGVIRELAAHPNIVGIKDSSGSFNLLLDLLRHCKSPSFRVWTGTEDLLAASLLLGAEGAVLGIPSLAPRLTCDIFEAARAGDEAKALALQGQFNELIPLLADGDKLSDAAFLGAVKMALSLRGLCEPTLAKPLTPISAAHAQRIRETMEAHGLLAKQAA